MYYCIQPYLFFSKQLNGPKYFYVSLTIQLNISHFFAHSWIAKVQFLTILPNDSHLFAHSLNVKQFHLTHR